MTTLVQSRSSVLPRAIAFAVIAGVVALLVVGLPTDVVPNSFFHRMTPVRPLDYLFLAISTLLSGALGATYAFPSACPNQTGKLTAGGFLSVLAVGCPICNKLVVLALGTTGAFSFFEPIQPLLGSAGLALLGIAVLVRFRAVKAAS